GACVGPTEPRRRTELLARRAVLALELAHGCDAVCAHHEMDRAGGEPARQAAGTERDLSDDRVLDEHRDDDLAGGREVDNGFRDARPGCLEGRRLRGDDVEYAELVPRVQQPARHAAAHSTEPDETHAHCCPSPVSCRSRKSQHSEAIVWRWQAAKSLSHTARTMEFGAQ